MGTGNQSGIPSPSSHCIDRTPLQADFVSGALVAMWNQVFAEESARSVDHSHYLQQHRTASACYIAKDIASYNCKMFDKQVGLYGGAAMAIESGRTCMLVGQDEKEEATRRAFEILDSHLV